MLRHFFTIAFRSFNRNKSYSSFNVLGLTVAMGVCLLIYQYIYFELSFDRFHKGAQNIYRVTQSELRGGEDFGSSIYTPYALGSSAKETLPEVNDFVRIRPMNIGLIVSTKEKNQIHLEDGIWYVDASFLSMFNFALKEGDIETALKDPFNVVITEQMSEKYFGGRSAIGKSLGISGGIYSGDFVVSGVLKKLPENSHLQFNLLFPLDFIVKNTGYYKDSNGWDNFDFITYIRTHEGGMPNQTKNKLNDILTRHITAEAEESVTFKTCLQPIVDIHLKSGNLKDEMVSNNGSSQNLTYLGIIVFFILIMAWANYINLSTAQAIHRSREVGVRKSFGAFKGQLVTQFILEAGLVNVIAGILAVGLAYLCLPILNNILGRELSLSVLLQPEFWLWSSAVICAGAILSALYPAFILSSFKPVNIFKSQLSPNHNEINLRKTLIVLQYFISVIMIFGVYLMNRQTDFMKRQDLGIDMEKILVVNGPRVVIETLEGEGATLESKYQSFKARAVSHHGISGVSATYTVPGKGYFSPSEMVRRLGDPHGSGRPCGLTIVDTDFVDTYNMQLLASRDYKETYSPQRQIIINEEALEVFGLGSADAALNEKLIWGEDTVDIVAVVENVHWSSLKDPFKPILYFLDNEWGAYFSVKMNIAETKETIAQIKEAYRDIFPDDPFDYFFLDDEFNRQYQSDLQFGQLFSAFSALAVLIACLGLFALVSHSASMRIREFGIRKVLGASIGHLMYLLSREFLVLILIAYFVSFPFTFFLGSSYLENYAFRIDMGIRLFIVPGLILVSIAFLTVGYRTYITARENPVDSLRTE